ncbi:hypothetical protein [Fischerella thermalis]|uniref:hypothetical protein n=1 Tax=Fischerella thermalis TaxID=372787 RepID=UPI0015E07E0A|nr:hypothetical protein [Fischerella thermalis]
MGVGDASCFADTALKLAIAKVQPLHSSSLRYTFFHDVTLSALKICLPKNGIHPAKSV